MFVMLISILRTNMNKLFSRMIFFLLFLTVPILVHGQKNDSVLWEITGNGLTAKSYLFGTNHIASYSLLDSFPLVKTSMRESDFGLFESGGKSIGNVRDTLIISPPLDEIFTASEYALVDSFFTNSPFGSIKPHNDDASLQGMLQVVAMLNQEDTENQEMFFDEYLKFYMEDSLGKSIYQLDEGAQLARNYAGPDHRIIAEAIVALIKNDIGSKDLNASYFEEGLYNSDLLQDMKLNDDVAYGQVKDLTIERNLLWLPKIMNKMEEGSCFIAVGLTHLQYRTGLIALLREEGYELKPVKLSKSGE